MDALPRKDSGKINRAELAETCERLQKDLVKPFGIIDTGLRQLLRERAAQTDAAEAAESKK